MPEAGARDERFAHLTDAQRRAVLTVDRSVLVSAAAGSGKTMVLAERCAALVCDAPSHERCRIDELLVVTFTLLRPYAITNLIGLAESLRYVVMVAALVIMAGVYVLQKRRDRAKPTGDDSSVRMAT